VIDVRTLLLVSTIILVCRAALLAYAWFIHPSYSPIRLWAIGSALMALGAMLIGLREMIPLTVSVLLGHTAIIGGWMYTSAGTIVAAERVPPWRWGASVAVAALIATACFLLVWPDYGLRTIVVGIPGLMFDSYVVFTCLRFDRTGWRRTTLKILALAVAVSIVSSVLKNYYVVESGSTSLLDRSPLVIQYFLLSIVTMVTCTVLYLLLDAQKIQEDLADEIGERKRAEEAIRQMAYYDSLTQLPNRRMLHERLTLAIAGSKRSRLFGALMFVDLDNFKPLNDVHGHAVGDLLLVEAARRLAGSVRAVDTVARVGGDEFVVLLASLNTSEETSLTQALVVAEKIRARLAEPYVLASIHDNAAKVTVEHHCSSSIGVTMFQGETHSTNELMKQADQAMYKAKEAGRNSITVFGAER